MPEETLTENEEVNWDDINTFLNEDCREELNLVGELYPKKQSVEIDYEKLAAFSPRLSEKLISEPDEVIAEFNRAIEREKEHIPFARKVDKEEVRISARFKNLPAENEIMVRECVSAYLNSFFSMQGLVTTTTDILPKVWKGVFVCKRCRMEVEVIQSKKGLRSPAVCEGCGRREFDMDEDRSKYIDFQKIQVQEPLEILKGGDQAKRIAVWLEEDLVKKRVVPGQRIVITGSLRLEAPKQKGVVYQKFVEANNIEFTEQEFEELVITEEEEKEIKKLANDPKIYDKLVQSIAPSIYGHNEAKEAVMLQLCGGSSNKRLPDGTKIRDSIHILMIGDPGTAKSQILKFVNKLAPKSLYVSGKSASGGGLTAIAEKDEFGEGGWVLKAGALVLASGGLACLHPDSRVIVDKKIQKVSKLFDENRSFEAESKGSKIEICELDAELPSWEMGGWKSKISKTDKVRRKEYSGKLLKLKLSSGNELCLTPDHKLIDGNTAGWKEAKEFKDGDFLLSPLLIPGFEEEQYIRDIIPKDWLVSLSKEEKDEIKSKVLEIYTTITEFNKKFDLDKNFLSGSKQISLAKFEDLLQDLKLQEDWKGRCLSYSRSFASKRLAKSKIDEDVCYLMGFIYGDGSVSTSKRRSSFSIVQSKKNKEQIERIRSSWKAVFGEDAKPYERKTKSMIRGTSVESDCFTFHKSSNTFVQIYKQFTKDKLKNLMELSDSNLAAFVAGALDSDGCVAIKKYKKESRDYLQAQVNFLLNNDYEESLNFALALRRFDCYGKVREGRGVKEILISGRNDVETLIGALKPYSCKAVKDIPIRKNKVSGESDKLPMGIVSNICNEISAGNTQQFMDEGVWSNVYNFSKGRIQPSREQFGKIVNLEGISAEIRSEAEKMLARDYFLDRIVAIEEEDYTGYVYDLHVPSEHNFVADGCFVHNCIDEFDKMSEDDRSAIHEALEQQTVSVAKAGIIATFRSDSAVLAAANPKYSRYDPYKPPAEQFNIPASLISRFDLIFPIKDVLDATKDKQLADHILNSHKLSETIAAKKKDASESMIKKLKPIVEQDVLKKYFAYARRNCHPILTDEAIKRVSDYYVDLRKRSSGGSVPLTPRQLEGLVRLAEASAKVRLSETVEIMDAERAIRLVEFVLREIGMDEEGEGFDIDRIMSDHPKSERDKIYTITGIVKGLEEEYDQVPITRVLEEAKEFHGIDERTAEKLIHELLNKGDLYEPKHGHIKVVGK